MHGTPHTPLVRRQDGLITRPQLLALGWSSEAVDHARETGWLHPVHPGVYSLTPKLTRRARWRAATLATHSPLSHVSACAIHGLLADRRLDVEVVTTRSFTGPRGIVVRRTRSLPESDVTVCHGIPATTPTRAVLDISQTVDRDTFLTAAMQALHEEQLDVDRVLAMNLAGRRGAASISALRKRLTDRTRTELEAAMLELCLGADLPRPLCQHRIGRSTVDFAWLEPRVVVETDGWDTHRGRAAFERDRARDAWLATRGWTVLRFTWRQLFEQSELVLAALGARLGA